MRTAGKLDTDSGVHFVGMVRRQYQTGIFRDCFEDFEIARVKVQAIMPGKVQCIPKLDCPYDPPAVFRRVKAGSGYYGFRNHIVLSDNRTGRCISLPR